MSSSARVKSWGFIDFYLFIYLILCNVETYCTNLCFHRNKHFQFKGRTRANPPEREKNMLLKVFQFKNILEKFFSLLLWKIHTHLCASGGDKLYSFGNKKFGADDKRGWRVINPLIKSCICCQVDESHLSVELLN